MTRLVAGLALAVLAVIGGVVFLWPTQRTGTEPINYGRDACAHCRMRISQPGFAGELRDRSGVLTKYDDIGCLLRAMLAMHREVPEAWVEDHDSGDLIPLLSATLVHAGGVETPMGYGIVAFRDGSTAKAFAESRHGEMTTLEDVLRNPTHLVPVQRMGGEKPVNEVS